MTAYDNEDYHNIESNTKTSEVSETSEVLVPNSMKKCLFAFSLLFWISLACRPVVTVGWGEVLIIGVILGVIIGPLLLRFYRQMTRDD